jgi:hypothetical protein
VLDLVAIQTFLGMVRMMNCSVMMGIRLFSDDKGVNRLPFTVYRLPEGRSCGEYILMGGTSR